MRPFIYPNTAAGLRSFERDTDRYIEYYLGYGQREFSISSWADYLEISRPTLYKLIKRGGSWDMMYNRIRTGEAVKEWNQSRPFNRPANRNKPLF